jgi:hypothetical protein
MATMTATQTETQPPKLDPKGNKTADLSLNATIEKFQQPSSDDDYNHAVSLIESRLDQMEPVAALFTVNLGPNQAELLIDARTSPVTLTKGSTSTSLTNKVDGKLHVRPYMIQRWVDGLMEARYSLSYGHIHLAVGTPPRIATKFIDGLTPFGARHPKLSAEMIPLLPRPTEDVARVRKDLKDFGYGLLKNALTAEELERLTVRLKEQAQGEADAGVAFFDGGESKPNQRVWNLPNKGREFIDLLDSNPTFDRFVPEFLGEDAYLFSYTANIAR